MPSAWNMFVKKIYEEGKAKDSNYEFKQALKDASKRKSEMGHSASMKKSKSHKRHRTAKRSRSASMAMAGGRRSRRHRRHRR
jgi:hypothetical protein